MLSNFINMEPQNQCDGVPKDAKDLPFNKTANLRLVVKIRPENGTVHLDTWDFALYHGSCYIWILMFMFIHGIDIYPPEKN